MYSADYRVGNGVIEINQYTSTGVKHIKAPFKPYFFIRSTDKMKMERLARSLNMKIELAPSTYHTIKKEPVTKVIYDHPRSVYQMKEQSVESLPTYEMDIHFIRRWMFDTRTKCDAAYELAAYIDIEASDENGFPNAERDPIICIGLIDSRGGRRWFRGPRRTSDPDSYEKEKKMLWEFWTYVRQQHYGVLMAWNGFGFDFNYIFTRMKLLGVPFNKNEVRWLDLLPVHKYVSGQRPKNDLDTVAEELLGEKKIYHGKRVVDLPDDLLEEYNLHDCHLEQKIDEKEGLLSTMILLARESYMFPDEVLGMHDQIATPSPLLDMLILDEMRKYDYALPTKTKHPRAPYQGAIVLEGKPGLYKSIMTSDFSSLYPSVMICWRISPEEEKIVIPTLMRRYYEKKEASADDPIKYRSFKLVLNACYGVLASEYFRLYSPELAAEIAARARDFFIAAEKITRDMGFPIIYGDTDSIFIDLSDFVADPSMAPVIGRSVNNELNRRLYEQWKDKVKDPSFIPKMVVDSFWSKFFIPHRSGGVKTVKKRYAGYKVYGKDWTPYDKPKFAMKGIEIIRSDWTKLAKTVQERVLKMRLDEVEESTILDYLREMKEKLYSGALDGDLIIRKSLNKGVSEYKVSTPALKALEALPEPDKERIIAGRFVTYVMAKGAKKGGVPTAVLDESPKNLDYDWYWSHQVVPIAERLGVAGADDIDNSKLDAF